jgi:hypothetical protein
VTEDTQRGGESTTCLRCGERLIATDDAACTAARSAAPTLVRCPACDTEQVLGGAPALCDGQRTALRHALAYLRRRRT